MDETSNLKLPYILAAQSQKHVTHNEALRALDAIVQLAVADKDLATPPGSPTEGARYIVGASPTGAWSGHAGDIAAYQDAAWAFYAPQEGWQAWVADEGAFYVFDGADWVAGSALPVALMGVNATADATNRLAVSSPASLFNHEGAGHQIKINKNTAGDTGCVLFQTGFSGRAEFGLAGDDNFHVKVSPDGGVWHEALVIDRTTGLATFPLTPRREVLTADRTYYVRSDGNDGNDGLSNTSGGAFLTIQKAIDVVGALDISIYTVTIQVADGTYTGGCAVSGPWVGSGTVILQGNPATPANCVLSVAGTAIRVAGSGRLTVRGFRITTTTSAGYAIQASSNSVISITGGMNYGALSGVNADHIRADMGSVIAITAGYTISGNARYHVHCLMGSIVETAGVNVTLSGTPSFSQGYLQASLSSCVRAFSQNFSGSATGRRYAIDTNSVVFTNGGGASYFPGSSAGTTATGGQYV